MADLMQLYLMVLSIIVSAAALAAVLRPSRQGLVFLAADEDIKIAPDSMAELFAPKDLAQDAADAFVQQRSNGNVAKARRLGKKLARSLPHTLPGQKNPPQDSEVLKQIQVLYSYLVMATIEEQSPNSILAQTALSVYYQTVREASQQDYDATVDSAGFTLYRLARRRGEDLGTIFAELCGSPQDPKLVEEGSRLYQRYQAHCLALCQRAGYQS